MLTRPFSREPATLENLAVLILVDLLAFAGSVYEII